jgi:parvulin-like peptidyl-prolyl isomerase
MKLGLLSIVMILSAFIAQGGLAQAIIEDQGVDMSREEVDQVVQRWPAEMQRAAANDLGDRMELLNQALANKKIALEAEKLTPESDPEAYWEYRFMIQQVQGKFVFDRYMDELEVPDMSALAQERYETQKDKYALVKERRLSSHILFACPPGCDREPLRPKAAEVLADLRAGADFKKMVAEHSQDPGTKANGGRFAPWLKMGEPHVAPPYLGGLFSIEEIGGYSDVVDTQFGLHIIRLDDIEEAHYLPWEEVKDDIIKRLQGEYRELAAKEFKARFRLSDEVRIDGDAMEAIFEPYKTAAE